MEILVRDSDVVSLVLGFLHSRELYESALALEHETGFLASKDELLPEDLRFLRQLALDGKWDLVLSYLEPFTHLDEFNTKVFYYLVLRQRYFESLHSFSLTKSHSQRDTEELKRILEDVRPYCSQEEFHQLCQARNHSDLHDWSVVASRFRCFNNILVLFRPIYEDDSPGSATKSGTGDSWWQQREKKNFENRLLTTVTNALLYSECSKYCKDRATGTASRDAGLPWIASEDLSGSNNNTNVNAALLFWLRSLKPDGLFQQPFEEDDVEVKVEQLKKKTTPRDIQGSTEPTTRFSSFASPLKQRKENIVNPTNSPAVARSMQISSKERVRSQSNPLSASGPARHTYQTSRNYSNNNNNNEHGEPPSSDGQKEPEPLPRKGEHTGGTRDPPSDQHKGPTELHQNFDVEESYGPEKPPPGYQEVLAKDGIVNVGQHNGDSERETPQSVKKVKVLSSEAMAGGENMNQENQEQIQDQIIHSVEKPLRDSSNLVKNDSTEERHGDFVKVGDSYADFLEEKKKLQSEKQKFLKDLENKEKKNDEIRKLLLKQEEAKESMNLQAHIEPHTSSEIDSNSKQVDNGFKKGVPQIDVNENHRAYSKRIYVPVEVTEDVQAIRAVSFHPSGLVYAVGSNSKTLRVCAVPRETVPFYPGSPNTSASRDLEGNSVKPSRVLVKRTHLHKGSIYSLGWNEEGSLIATGSNDKLIKILTFDVLAKSLGESPQEMAFHRGIVREVLFLNGRGDMLASAGGDGSVYTTDCAHNKMVHKLAGHSDHVLSLYSWHCRMIASSSQDRTIRLWDIRAPRCVSIIGVGTTQPCVPTSVCVDSSNRWLAMGLDNFNIGVYDLTAGKMAIEYKTHNGEVRSVRFNPVQTGCLLSSSYDGTIALTDVAGLLSEIDPATATQHHSSIIAKCKDKVIQCRWHPNGEDFASTSVDKTCKLWHRFEK